MVEKKVWEDTIIRNHCDCHKNVLGERSRAISKNLEMNVERL